MEPFSEVADGYWLPAALRPLVRESEWEVQHVAAGRPVPSGQGVTVRWPKLSPTQWRGLLDGLDAARRRAVPDLISRWGRALDSVPQILMQHPDMLSKIARYTGFPDAMLALALTQGELVQLGALAPALRDIPTWASARAWRSMPGSLPGALRFFPSRRWDSLTSVMGKRNALYRPLSPVALALGFAAGNVPGNGLMITLLLHVANHTIVGASSEKPPAVLVRNSRQSPLLSPWVLSAIEEVDAELVAGLAMLIWDYSDTTIQRELLGRSELVMAAASDSTIDAIDADIRASGRPVRFHRHGHKVSFAVVGRAALEGDLTLVSGLAALDSTFWDQYGCLSARVHFVERQGGHTPEQYAAALTREMRRLADRMPRGVAPIRLLHRAYDVYKLLEPEGKVRVLTDYDDECLVVLDDRDWNADQWRATVNRCIGRAVVVRSVDDLSEIPSRYLRWLPKASLQSLSVAVCADRAVELADAAGACGVTALRSLGRAAFPQMVYSWDGLLPLDLGNHRPPGHFTTLATDDPLADLALTASRMGL